MPSVRILHLEDDSIDHELIASAMRMEGLDCEVSWVSTRRAFEEALDRGSIDVILADYHLPGFDGQAALELSRLRQPSVPFLFVSGFIGEEVALETLKAGATDYVFKHNLARLVPAVRRALQESRDQRERRQAQDALRESESILRSFFNTAPFLMGIVELLPGDILHLSDNAASARFLGSTREMGRPVRASELGIPAAVIAEWSERFQESHQQGRPVEFECLWTGGTKPRQLSVGVSELPSIPPQPSRFCYVAEDVTEKKQLEQQLFRAQRLESIGTLASGIAHDLNNVLAPIIMALKLFRPKLTDPDDQELLCTLDASARRGADIVQQVLTFGRGVEGVRQPLELQKLIRDIERIIRDTFPRSIRLECLLGDQLWKTVGDATQIYQVLMNLCLNARDAMPVGGRLLVQAENIVLDEKPLRGHPEAKPGAYVVLTVADSGSGIPLELITRIFDPFFTTKEVGKGTGLGLPTVSTIVKSHRGFIDVTSQPGHGSEFKVYLPAERQAAVANVEPGDLILPRGHGELVLIVDDDATIRQVTKVTLLEQGYDVMVAADGSEALGLFAQHRARIKLVITDMMMPILDGGALIQSMTKLDPHVRVIAVSGLLDNSGHLQLPQSDQLMSLQKPFSAEKLLLAIDEMLHRSGTPFLL